MTREATESQKAQNLEGNSGRVGAHTRREHTKKASDFVGLELQVIVSHLTWVLGT